MATLEECKTIGYNACIEKIGRDICVANRERGSYGFSVVDGGINCFVGCSDENEEFISNEIIMDDRPFDYSAYVFVNTTTGEYKYL